MSLHVKPDPKRPTGGYAQIEGDFEGSEVSVSVFNTFAERYLGEHGWQSVREEFGPYRVDRSGGTARIVVGPEIVNQLEEYAHLRFQVGAVVADLNWPDTIAQRPGAAALGGIRVAGGKASSQPRDAGAVVTMAVEGGDEANAASAVPDEAEGGDPVGAPTPGGGDDEAETGGKDRKRPLWLIIALMLVVLALAATAAWFFWLQDGNDTPVAEVEEETVQPEPAITPEAAPTPVAENTCSSEALLASSGQPFAEVMSQLEACGEAADLDATMMLIENAALADNPQALLLFGELYDDTHTNAVVEDAIGVTFADNPAQAAEYYARARDAGSSEANIRLVPLCERLGRLSDTLSQAAFGDYC